MDFSFFNIVGAFIDLDFAFSRLHDISKSLDSCEADSFYDDLYSLFHSVDSLCAKYSKES